MMIMISAHGVVEYHSGEESPRPSSNTDSNPYRGLKMYSQSIPTAIPDKTYGANATVRAKPRPASFWFSSRANSSPSTSPPPTVDSPKTAVVVTTVGVLGSENHSTQVPKPMNLPTLEPIFHCSVE